MNNTHKTTNKDPKKTPKPTASTKPNQGDGVGEGNRAATQRYNAGVAQSEARGDSDKLAQEAKRAVEGSEGDELRKAEAEGKRGEPRIGK